MMQSIIDSINGFTDRNGILVSQEVKNISYPAEDNDTCFQIEENSFWFKHRNNCITELVKKYVTENFADIGGGNGYAAKAIQDIGIKTILIEPGIDGCVNARKRGLQNVICSTLENAPLKEKSIQAIGLFDVIEHIERDYEFLIQAKKYLKDSGFVFITVPAYNFLWSKEDEDSGHYRRYTLKSVQKVLSYAGFKTIYSTYIFSILPLPIFLSRTIPSILGLNKNSHDKEKLIGEHKAKGKSILDKIWQSELRQIQQGKKIPFGSSCLVVAKVI